MAARGELVLHHLSESRSLTLLWLLEELGAAAPYTVKSYLRVGGRAPPELKAVHPLGKSPVITDGGVCVAESGNIVRHLCETRDEARALQPAADDAAGRAAHSFFLHYVEGSIMSPVMLDFILRKAVDATPWLMRGATRAIRNAIYANFAGPELDRHAAFLEGVLAKSEYITGARFTAADTHLLFAAERLLEGDPARAAASPKLAAWVKKVKQRPAYLRAAARDKELEMVR